MRSAKHSAGATWTRSTGSHGEKHAEQPPVDACTGLQLYFGAQVLAPDAQALDDRSRRVQARDEEGLPCPVTVPGVFLQFTR
jgi:hypothetical protein